MSPNWDGQRRLTPAPVPHFNRGVGAMTDKEMTCPECGVVMKARREPSGTVLIYDVED